MNCGIYCVKRLLEDLNMDVSVETLEEKINEKGLSVYDIICFLNNLGINYQGYYCRKIILEEKMIIYDYKNKHYFYIHHYDKWFVYLDDVNVKKVRILRIFYPLIFSKYIIKEKKDDII